MTFFRFLRYEKSYICVYLIGFMLMATVFFLDVNINFTWGTFLYAFALCTIVLIGFLVFRYQQNVRAIHNIDHEAFDRLSLEAEQMQQLMDEMRKEHIREMNAVQEKQKEHYDFIVSWFHEIKTPIAVLHLIQQTDIDANSLREEIEKIENYVDQALYYAKLDSFNQDYSIGSCDMIGIVKDTVRDHSKTFISKKVRILLPSESMSVQSDSKWLKFIVNQLLTNSLKYTDNSGEILIGTNETPQEKQLIIRDNGIGITPQELPRIFNRGFTGETGRTYSKSTGMGLYLAQQLSNKLGHYITCTSEVSSYTEFIIHFPKDDDPFLFMNKEKQ
ncbi:HAMP domain-containing histidine kinase [Listeria monocytogenes]|uniref:histidine kinase n=2 Tax=Bacillota TaxID=1239 RepID=A0A6G7WJP5_9LACT|nr:HAMP domain-containing histidine kinase [Listeria monocytogenes]EGP5192675.1 sensor histidine kinase [Enterococcus faecium]NLD23128.1 HAMP domain-containing histidine kinase [Bacteroidales bacterium]QIK52401.1 HAMP domain-containing histidine kinase [Jeotgalibaca porci]EEP3917869.1 HAMP domain-containing histidine kinase [Listeria monocytogenes]